MCKTSPVTANRNQNGDDDFEILTFERVSEIDGYVVYEVYEGDNTWPHYKIAMHPDGRLITAYAFTYFHNGDDIWISIAQGVGIELEMARLEPNQWQDAVDLLISIYKLAIVELKNDGWQPLKKAVLLAPLAILRDVSVAHATNLAMPTIKRRQLKAAIAALDRLTM
jgi:hypothetical protein